jgi:fatty acid desaturase
MSGSTREAPARVENIGERGKRRRWRSGVVWLVLGIAAAIVMALRAASPMWFALLAVPFSAAALGYFQVKEST